MRTRVDPPEDAAEMVKWYEEGTRELEWKNNHRVQEVGFEEGYERMLWRARERAYWEMRAYIARSIYESGYTQQEVADMIGISQPRLSQILKDAPEENPSDMLQRK